MAVRKEFRTKEAFIDENCILQSLWEGEHHFHENVMEPLLSYSVGAIPKYNILFNEASSDLNKYLSNPSNFPEGRVVCRVKNIERMIGLAKGLQWLGPRLVKNRESGNFEKRALYHCDLRPENILVCPTNQNGDHIFKLSDFGNAVAKTVPLEPNPSHQGLTNVLRGIGRTYDPPETQPTKNSDVWSFGCIMLVVLIFNYESVEGVNEFLISLHRGRSSSTFHDSNSTRLNSHTTECMRYLKERTKNESDKQVTELILDLLKNKILVPTEKRGHITGIIHDMTKAYNKRDLITPITIRKQCSKTFRHCAQSPNGGFEVFHGKKTNAYDLTVWRQGQVAPLPPIQPISAPVAEVRPRIFPHSTACSNHSICQVVANQDPLEVYIHG